jgi:MFS family permease
MTDRERAALEANLRKFYLVRFLGNLQLWLPIWVLYLQKERGLSLAQITALDVPFWLIVVLVQIPTGAFADRFGRRSALIVGGLLLSFAYLAFGLAANYVFILAAYALWAVGMAFQSGADMALLYDNLVALDRIDEYPKAAGRAYGVLAAAAIVALLAGAKLAEATRLDVPVVASAGITLLATGIAATLKEPPHSRNDRPSLLTTIRNGARVSWREPNLRYVMGFGAALRAATLAPIILVQPFLAKYHAPLGAYGLLQSPARILAVCGALFAYRVFRRADERRIILALPLWFGSLFLALAAWDSPYAFVAFPLIALGVSAASPLLSDFLNRHTPADQRATVLSIGELIANLFLVGLEPALGVLAQSIGLQAAFAATTLFIAAISSVTLLPWALTRRGVAGNRQPAVVEP